MDEIAGYVLMLKFLFAFASFAEMSVGAYKVTKLGEHS